MLCVINIRMECLTCEAVLTDDNWAKSEKSHNKRRCRECSSAYKAAHYQKNKARHQENHRAWKEANPGRKAEIDAEYRASNREELRRREKLKRDTDPKIVARREERAVYWADRRATRKERQKEAIKAWGEANRAKVLAYAANYRALKKNATPPDADKEAIQAFYDQAVRMSALLGVPYEVDHIVPISKGGLHHQDNLVIMLRSANRRKSAKMLPKVIAFFKS